MTAEKAKGPGYEDLQIRFDDMLARLTTEFREGKPVTWPLVSKHSVARVWGEFADKGRVTDDDGLYSIYSTIRDNVIRLQIANIVSGHESISPELILEDYLEEPEFEPFSAWLINYEDGWRISDYGILPLQDALALAFEAKTSEARLKYVDRALHVTHMRGDLSKLFIEGGRGYELSLRKPDEGVELKAA